MPRRVAPIPATVAQFPTPHADWIEWLEGRPAQVGDRKGEPINRSRIAERMGRSRIVVASWATRERRDLQAREWTVLLSVVMEEIGGAAWPKDYQMAVYWGGPALYDRCRQRRLFPLPPRTRKRAA